MASSSASASAFRAEDLGVEIVTIYVGPKRKHFTVHKKLICNNSKFFLGAFNGGSKEAIENSIHLVEDDPDVFDYFVVWMYRGTLPNTKETPDSREGPKASLRFLIKSFIFGEGKLCINRFQNQLLDKIRYTQGQRFANGKVELTIADIKRVYKNISPKSKLALYMAACVAFKFNPGPLLEDRVTTCTELCESVPGFTRNFLTMLHDHGSVLRSTDPRSGDWDDVLGDCFFHIHENGETCHLNQD